MSRSPFARSVFPRSHRRLAQGVGLVLLGSALFTAVGCTKGQERNDAGSVVKTRDMRKDEALADLSEISNKVKALYGPLEFKERRFGFKWDDLVAKARTKIEASKSEPEMLSAMMELVGALEDGHVSLKFPVASDSAPSAWKIPVFLQPVEGKALVSLLAPEMEAAGLAVGDEVVSVDGRSPFDIAKGFQRYSSLGNPLSDLHFVALSFQRPAFMPEFAPTSAKAKVDVRKADGTQRTVELVWERTDAVASTKGAFPSASGRKGWFTARNVLELENHMRNREAGLTMMGSPTPFFLTPAVKAATGIVQVKPSVESLARFGIDDASKAPDIYAGLYRHEGKTILLVRQPTYNIQEAGPYLATYRALFAEYASLVDVMVVDQTHNPGGSLDYCEGFFRLFARSEARTLVQRMHADREWLRTMKTWAQELEPQAPLLGKRVLAMAAAVENAYDAGKELTDEFLPLGSELTETVRPDEGYVWTKPVLVLADELAGSCGDIFPMLMKNNGVAEIFGERTMGLGGNVEQVAVLSNSRGELSLTRGLFATSRADGKYTDADLVENEGVKPDHAWTHSVDDVRAGYVGYVAAFTKVALTKAQEAK